jgi:hypothetical protein
MAKANDKPSYESAVEWLREHGFDVLEAPGVQNRVFLKKNNVSAAIEREADGSVRLFARPGYVIRGEIARLVDRGFQKFLKTTKGEIPATAEHLEALREFNEELRSATDIPTLYNEAIGSVSDAYQYDRVVDRDKPAAQRPVRPWEEQESKGKKRA